MLILREINIDRCHAWTFICTSYRWHCKNCKKCACQVEPSRFLTKNVEKTPQIGVSLIFELGCSRFFMVFIGLVIHVQAYHLLSFTPLSWHSISSDHRSKTNPFLILQLYHMLFEALVTPSRIWIIITSSMIPKPATWQFPMVLKVEHVRILFLAFSSIILW